MTAAYQSKYYSGGSIRRMILVRLNTAYRRPYPKQMRAGSSSASLLSVAMNLLGLKTIGFAYRSGSWVIFLDPISVGLSFFGAIKARTRYS